VVPDAPEASSLSDATETANSEGASDTATETADSTAETAEAEEKKESATPVLVHLDVAPWAEVYVNGARKGVSPPMKSFSLPPGTYNIELRNGGQQPVQQKLVVQPGRSASISHHF